MAVGTSNPGRSPMLQALWVESSVSKRNSSMAGLLSRAIFSTTLVLVVIFAQGCGKVPVKSTPYATSGPTPLGPSKIQKYVKERSIGLNIMEDVFWKENGVLHDPVTRVTPLLNRVDVWADADLNKTMLIQHPGRSNPISAPKNFGVTVVVSLSPDLAVCTIRQVSRSNPAYPFYDWGSFNPLVERLNAMSRSVSNKATCELFGGTQAPLGDRIAVVSNNGLEVEVDQSKLMAGPIDISVDGVIFTFNLANNEIGVSRRAAAVPSGQKVKQRQSQ